MKEYGQDDVGGVKGRPGGHPGLEAEPGQKGLSRIVQQGILALQDAMEAQVRTELERS
jgi:hypothetical protein